MVTAQENETLCQVGPGTPMGNWMRLYWRPFYPADQLPADGQPKRIALLGEDLVAFRDTAGKVGLVANACPHRGAPLMFGRNEECGLRCVYHGWKFDVDGKVLATRRARRQPPEGPRAPQILCLPRAGRRALGLYGRGSGQPAAPAPD
jgi:phthalate 4,5-dioxygenase